jgi:muramoyltetrapeptide carboxypeptidase LdcA involved in peptidoglycan recycling
MTASCWFCCPAFGVSPEERDPLAAHARELAALLPAAAAFGDALAMPDQQPWPDARARVRDLESAWDHRYLWPLRGGSGCLHLIDALGRRPTPAPMLLGYSDITVLHAWWFRHGWGETCYTAMAADRTIGERTRTTLATCLSGAAW